MKNNKISILILLLATLIVYSNSLSNTFIWDDLDLIRDNPYIKDWKNIVKIFTIDLFHRTWKQTNFYRPLQTLSYMVDYSVWKLNPVGYHITNILLHFLCGLLIFFLALLIVNDRFGALISSLFFLVHPVHTEAISYISGRADPLATFLFLLSIILFIKSNSNFLIKRWCLYMASLSAFILGLFSKEMFIIFPLILILYYFTFEKITNKKVIKIMQILPFFIISIIYIYLRLTVLNFSTDKVLAETIPIQSRLLTMSKVIFIYLGILFLPFKLHMDREVVPAISFFELGVFPAAFFLLISLFLIIKSYKRSQVFFFSSIWFFITLLPVSNIFPLNAFISEHWLYLPSVGLFLLLGLGIKKLRKVRRVVVKQSVLFLTVFTLIFYSVLTIQQNSIWKNPITFYQYTLRFAPHRPRLHNNLGNAYYEKGLYAEAIREYNTALKINQDFADAHFNLGNLYYKTEKIDEAIREYKEVLRINPKYADACFNLGNLYYTIGKLDEAINEYQKTITIEKDNAAAYHNLGNVYFMKAEYVKAIREFTSALKLEPNNTDLLLSLGDAYRQIKNLEKAVDIYNRVLTINPGLVNAYINLGVIYSLRGEFDETIKVYNIALQWEPNSAILHVNLGSAYANMDNFTQAEKEWKRALELDPNYEKARHYLDKLKTFANLTQP